MKTLALVLGLVALSFSPAANAGQAPVRDFEGRLQALVASGELDPGRADLYRLYAVTDADRLPAALRTGGSDGTALRTEGGSVQDKGWIVRCGTSILREVRTRLDTMSPEVRAEAEAILSPPRPHEPSTSPHTAALTGEKVVAHVLPNWVLTPNFSVEWGPALTNEDGSTPVRDENANGVPDVVERWAELFEGSYAAETAILKPGSPDAVFAGTGAQANLIPVYIGNSSPTLTIENISRGTYALTSYSSGDPTPFILVNNDLSFVPPNQDPAGKIPGAMKITAAHELFHVVHFLYEPDSWRPTEDDWWLETSATWMEDEVFDGVNDYLQYFGSSGWTAFVEAGLPVHTDDPHYIVRAYGGVIFGKYLSEHVGGQAMMGELWDLIRPVPAPGRRILDALDVYAASQGLTDAETLFLGFSAANAVMDYREGGAYGSVPIRNAGSLDHAETAAALVPGYLGSTYLRRDAGAPGSVTVGLAGQPLGRWGLSLLAKRATGYSLALGAVGASGSASLALANLGAADELYAIPSFLSPPPAASVSYATSEAGPIPADTTAPGAPAGLLATALVGGFDAAWLAPGAADVSGYVVRWRPTGTLAFTNRTVVAPVQSIEVRGLGVGTYNLQVFAYDANGNADPAAAGTTSVTVLEAGGDAPIPPAASVILELHLGSGSSGGGGGGGGGGCFLGTMVR
jgi:hypothetical protein